MCFLHNKIVCFCADAIASKWSEFGVTGTTEDIANVVDVLSGTGSFIIGNIDIV